MICAGKLEAFVGATTKDCRISRGHLALYLALLHFWEQSQYSSPISLFAHQAMPVAKISSNATYHRLIRDLHDFGYIRYCPSFYKAKASLVYL